MWIFLGIGAIIAAILNVSCLFTKRDPKWFRFTSLALTALTVCSSYALDAKWVLAEDWGALMDTTPYVSKMFLGLTIASIVINGMTLFIKEK